MSWFIHPRYLSAYAAAADRDPDLRRGTHLRLFPSDLLGFPLAPWRLWHLPALMVRDLPIQWFDRRGQPLSALDLDAAGGEAIGWVSGGLANQARLIGVEARLAAGAPGEIAVLDGVDQRVITSRSSGRLLVGAPRITSVRLRGRGPFELLGWVVLEDRAFETMMGSDPFAILSAPIEGDLPWYAGGRGRLEARARVVHGAPLRWTRPDRPDGPFDPLSRQAEETRVAVVGTDLDADMKQLVADAAVRPRDVSRTHVKASPQHEVTEHLQGTLLLRAVDPGVGRYLGMLTLLEHLPDMDERPQPPTAEAWLAAGLFALPPGARRGLPAPDAFEQRLIERLLTLEPRARRVVAMVSERHRLTVRAFVAPSLAAPMQDLPSPPAVSLGEAAWLREKQGPSVAFRQQLRVTAPPLATLAALARLEPQGWVTRHELLDQGPGASPAQRAAPILLGSTHNLAWGRVGLVEESRVPAAGAPWIYQLALSDVCGRFGEPAEIQVPLPPRPGIPAPTLQLLPKLAERAPHDQPSPAGSVRTNVAVPALDSLGAGARPLSRVWVTLDGATQDSAVPQGGGMLAFEFALPALLLMEHRRLSVRARFEDDQGTMGPEATESLDVADPRSPPVPKTGIGIVWSSRPGPAEDVEIRVRFGGLAGARYRVYATDARGLDLPPMDGNRPRTRAEIAVDGAQRGLNGLGLRERFRLLTDQPLTTGADGSVVFDARFPRSLETVQFLRFVPLGARGAEAAFDRCPLLPVAVPSDRQPPPPRLSVEIDPATGAAEVTILAEGLDLVALDAAEPGLFSAPPDANAQRPEFRLRRASGAVPEAIYAREVARGVLERHGTAFKAVIGDPAGGSGLLDFVRYHYWAEVRLPPERRLPAGTQELILPSGSIHPLQPAQRQNAPRAYSASSAPAAAMRVPPQPATLEAGMVSAAMGPTPGGWRLAFTVTGGPVAHTRAVGAYRLQIHIERTPGELSLEDEQPLAQGSLSWDRFIPGAQPAAARLGLVLVDPVGRAASPLFVDV
jgi:hypothetical protein